MEPITVAVVEDESLFRNLLVAALERSNAVRVVGAYADAQAALEHIPRLNPDVVLLDIELRAQKERKAEIRGSASPANGIELGFALRRQLPRLGVILLSNHCEPEFLTAIPPEKVAGWSYLLKQSVEHVDTLLRAITGSRDGLVVLDPRLISAARGADSPVARLTPRQREVLQLIASGLTNRAIADTLSLSEKTIQNQINLIYDKLDIDRRDTAVQPRVQAVLTFLRHQ